MMNEAEKVLQQIRTLEIRINGIKGSADDHVYWMRELADEYFKRQQNCPDQITAASASE